MSSNTLVAICVGCLFALALVTIIVSYMERVRSFRRYERHVERNAPVAAEEKVTEKAQWPRAGDHGA